MAPPPSSPNELTLAPCPARERLEALGRQQEALGERIAQIEEEIAELEETLLRFEAQVQAHLAEQERRLGRLEDLVRHAERWIVLLEQGKREHLVPAAERLEARRAQQTRSRRQAEASSRTDVSEPARTERRAGGPDLDALKRVYRLLVRLHHPDLARTEEDRLHRVALLQRITDLYRAGDLARLETLAATGQAEMLPADSTSAAALLPQAEQRLAWFQAVLQNRLEERRALERSELFQLWQEAEASRASGRDLLDTLRRRLDRRLAARARDLAWVYRRLEQAVKRHNRPPASPVRRQVPGRLEPVFDPLASRPLVRWGLEELAFDRAPRSVQQEADWVEALAERDPPLVRLLLFAHVSELTRLPLPGLETYDELKLRFEFGLEAEQAMEPQAGRETAPDRLREPAPEDRHEDPSEREPEALTRPCLESVLAQAADRVEFGVRHATSQFAFLGLRFRSEITREAVALALRAAPVRHAFRQVLQVLGEQAPCPGCGQDTFSVPVYRTRGLDELRAMVCPNCGHERQRYYLPKGDDLQTVLNPAYLDLGLVEEFTFDLSRAWVALQLLPIETETMAVGALKARLVSELFRRYNLELGRRHLRLYQQGRPVTERTPLATLPGARFEVRLRSDAPMSLRDAVERLRHRIRHRFSPDTGLATP